MIFLLGQGDEEGGGRIIWGPEIELRNCCLVHKVVHHFFFREVFAYSIWNNETTGTCYLRAKVCRSLWVKELLSCSHSCVPLFFEKCSLTQTEITMKQLGRVIWGPRSAVLWESRNYCLVHTVVYHIFREAFAYSVWTNNEISGTCYLKAKVSHSKWLVRWPRITSEMLTLSGIYLCNYNTNLVCSSRLFVSRALYCGSVDEWVTAQ